MEERGRTRRRGRGKEGGGERNKGVKGGFWLNTLQDPESG